MTLIRLTDGKRTWFVNSERIAYITASYVNPKQTVVWFSGIDDDCIALDNTTDEVIDQIYLK